MTPVARNGMSVGLFLVTISCAVYKDERWILDSDTTANWSLIEWNNPECPPLPPGRVQTVEIPSDGNFCTSSSRPDVFNDRFFVRTGGTLRELVRPQDKVERSDTTFEGRRFTAILWVPPSHMPQDNLADAWNRYRLKFPGKPPSITAFKGLRSEYSAADTIEFSIENASPEERPYWIGVEELVGDHWLLVYSSLAGLQTDMSHPEPTILPAQSTQAVRWRPSDDNTFLSRNAVSSTHRYRFKLSVVPEPLSAEPGLTWSKPIRIGPAKV